MACHTEHNRMSGHSRIANIWMRFFISLVCLYLPITLFAQTDEYTMKIVLLERFTRFVEWPEDSAVSDTSRPFVLGIMGNHPFGTKPEEIYSTRKIRNKSVEIRYVSELDEIKDCHLLFISKSEEKELLRILSFTKDKPILTVGDTEGFAKEGVLINLYLKEDKVHFEINESSVKKSNLTMSYLLLQTGEIVKPRR